MNETDRVIENSRRYTEAFDKGELGRQPARNLAVVACMDARLDPARVLGLEEGDAHVIRNAGGVVTDGEVRDLAISQHLLGTSEIVVIQHTDCGMLNLDDEEFARRLEANAGERPSWRVHTFTDLDDNVRASLHVIRDSPFIPNKTSVRGFVYDVKTGSLREVT